VQLTDPKGRHRTITLSTGEEFHTHRGRLVHDDFIGQDEGVVVNSSGGTPYLALRPLLSDFVLGMKRGPTIVYPKDAAVIVGLLDLFPGAVVAEAGVGSGALTCSLLRAVGPRGRVLSYEVRPEFAAVAETNVHRWFGSPPPGWRLRMGAMQEMLGEETCHAVALDMLAPWECVDAAYEALVPGGVLVAYVATATQMSRVVETLREAGGWTDPQAQETLLRGWHLEGLAVRPDHRMQGHTGFLVSTRRLATGSAGLPRRSRPAPGAYGPDYKGPNQRAE